MKVLRTGDAPYREVDPEDVVVTDLVSGLWGLCEAYGYLLSECVESIDVPRIRNEWLAGRLTPTTQYRVAYQLDDGSWQAEGTVTRERPPESILRQLEAFRGLSLRQLRELRDSPPG